MITMESQVCPYELAKELFEVGLNAESYFYWHPVPMTKDREKIQLWPSHMLAVKTHSGIPAYTIGEMLHILYTYTNWEFVDLKERMADYLAEILLDEIRGHQLDPKEVRL